MVETECLYPKIKNKTRMSNLVLVDSSSNETKTEEKEKEGKGRGERQEGRKQVSVLGRRKTILFMDGMILFA